MKAHTEAIEIASRRRLAELEKVINRGKKSFVEVGRALAEIRDLRLYKPEFKSFEDYCQEKWGWTKQHAYRLIECAPVVKSNPQVTSINQARELARVPEADRAEVLEAAVEAGPLTARTIREAAEEARVPKASRAEVLEAVVKAPPAACAIREAEASLGSPSPYRIVSGRCVVLQAGWTFGRRVLRKLLKEVTAD